MHRLNHRHRDNLVHRTERVLLSLAPGVPPRRRSGRHQRRTCVELATAMPRPPAHGDLLWIAGHGATVGVAAALGGWR